MKKRKKMLRLPLLVVLSAVLYVVLFVGCGEQKTIYDSSSLKKAEDEVQLARKAEKLLEDVIKECASENELFEKARERYDEKQLTFEIVDDHVEITGYRGKEWVYITFPSRLDGKPVTVIRGDMINECSGFGWENTALLGVEIPDSITTIGPCAFKDARFLLEAKLSGSVEEIGANAFENCQSLKKIGGNGKLKRILEYAFQNCQSIMRFQLPVTFEELGNGVFLNCQELREFIVDEMNPTFVSIDGVLFSGDGKKLEVYPAGKREKRYIIPEETTAIRVGAFSYNEYLDTVTIPDTVTTIEPQAFAYCKNLAELTFPEDLTVVETMVCSQCASLKQVSFREKLEWIKERAFDGCEKLENVSYEGTEEDWKEKVKVDGGNVSLKNTVFAFGIKHPLIAIQYAPKRGEENPIIGQVYTEYPELDVSPYKIAIFVQPGEGEECVKKTTVPIGEDGYFTGLPAKDYTYENVDVTEAELLYILLIPIDYEPVSYAETVEKAVDAVTIRRVVRKETTILPKRDVTESVNLASAISNPFSIEEDAIALNVGFFTNGDQPGDPISEERIRNILETIKPACNVVRFYSSSGQSYRAYAIAHDMGFKVAGTADLTKDNEEYNKREMDALVEHCNSGYVQLAIVGNETLLGGKRLPSQLIGDLTYVREKLNDSAIPVTTSEDADTLLNNIAVVNACNCICINEYPFWGSVDIENAKKIFVKKFESVQTVVNAVSNNSKDVIVMETGWPSEGEEKGAAIPSEENAARYFEEVREWSLESKKQIFWFEAIDEKWKRVVEPNKVGDHWGVFTIDSELKGGYAKTKFWVEHGSPHPTATPEPTGSPIPTPVPNPILSLSYVPRYGERQNISGQVIMDDGKPVDTSKYRITLFVQIEGSNEYWIKPDYAHPTVSLLPNGDFSASFISGGTDEYATKIHVMLIPESYTPSVVFNEMLAQALDYVVVDRTSNGEIMITPPRADSR